MSDPRVPADLEADKIVGRADPPRAADRARYAYRGRSFVGRCAFVAPSSRNNWQPFGGVSQGFPKPRLPPITTSRFREIVPTALSFTLLGGVESLLSAKVADGMTGRKHRYNMELVAQGIANVISALFGGISVTGTIARTATNIRAGAVSPFAGMMHAGFVLIFMAVAAPLASFIPLSALAGVLVVVCWNMAEKKEFFDLLRDWRTAAVLLATFGLTIAKDLTFGIVTGCILALVFAFFNRAVAKEGI